MGANKEELNWNVKNSTPSALQSKIDSLLKKVKELEEEIKVLKHK